MSRHKSHHSLQKIFCRQIKFLLMTVALTMLSSVSPICIYDCPTDDCAQDYRFQTDVKISIACLISLEFLRSIWLISKSLLMPNNSWFFRSSFDFLENPMTLNFFWRRDWQIKDPSCPVHPKTNMVWLTWWGVDPIHVHTNSSENKKFSWNRYCDLQIFLYFWHFSESVSVFQPHRMEQDW